MVGNGGEEEVAYIRMLECRLAAGQMTLSCARLANASQLAAQLRRKINDTFWQVLRVLAALY